MEGCSALIEILEEIGLAFRGNDELLGLWIYLLICYQQGNTVERRLACQPYRPNCVVAIVDSLGPD